MVRSVTARALLAALSLLFGSWADTATTNEGSGAFLLKAATPHASAVAARAPARMTRGHHGRGLTRIDDDAALLAGVGVFPPTAAWGQGTVPAGLRVARPHTHPASGRAPPRRSC